MGLLRGAAAGAAGITALDTITHADMALRGRPASRTPHETVERLAARAGIRIPDEGARRERRLAGLAGLAGVVIAVGVGGAVGPIVDRLPAWLPLRAAVLGTAMMAGINVPMIAAGVTDPRSWSAADLAADLLPNLTYGAAAAAVLSAGRDST